MEKNTHNSKLKSLVKIGDEYLQMNFLIFPKVGSIPNLASAYFKNPGSYFLICQNKFKFGIFKARPPFCSPIFSRKNIKMPRHPVPCVDFLRAKDLVEWSEVPWCLIPTFIVSWLQGRICPCASTLTPYVKTQ